MHAGDVQLINRKYVYQSLLVCTKYIPHSPSRVWMRRPSEVKPSTDICSDWNFRLLRTWPPCQRYSWTPHMLWHCTSNLSTSQVLSNKALCSRVRCMLIMHCSYLQNKPCLTCRVMHVLCINSTHFWWWSTDNNDSSNMLKSYCCQPKIIRSCKMHDLTKVWIVLFNFCALLGASKNRLCDVLRPGGTRRLWWCATIPWTTTLTFQSLLFNSCQDTNRSTSGPALEDSLLDMKTLLEQTPKAKL